MCTSKVFYKSLIFLLEISPDFNEAEEEESVQVEEKLFENSEVEVEKVRK